MINHAIDLFVAKVNSGMKSRNDNKRRQQKAILYRLGYRCWTVITDYEQYPKLGEQSTFQ